MIIPLITALITLTEPAHFYASANVQQDTQHVMVRGIISAIGTNTFTIGEHTIYIDAAKTGSFRQMGTIAVDARAEVKTRRIDGVLYAQQVIIVGTGQGRTQIIVKAKHQGTLKQLGVYLKNALKLFASVSI